MDKQCCILFLRQLDLPARASRLSVTLSAKVSPSIFYTESKAQPEASQPISAMNSTSDSNSTSAMALHVTKDWHIHDIKTDREIDDLHLRKAGKEGYTLYVLGR